MYCTECGAQIDDETTVCPKCGVPVAGKNVAAAANVHVPSHMVGAILTTVFCCVIGGIVAMVYASQVNTKLATSQGRNPPPSLPLAGSSRAPYSAASADCSTW